MTYALRRAAMGIAIGVVLSVVVFLLLHGSGDLAVNLAGESATREQIDAIRVQYGLDQPLPVQYWRWFSGVLRGDLGHSAYLAASVMELIAAGLPNTLKLSVLAMGFATFVALPLGVAAAARPGGWMDRIAMAVAVTGQAIPTFWMGLMLIFVVAMTWGLTPISGSETWAHFILPAIALGYHAAPPLIRLTRTAMLDALSADYIRTAHAKGLHPLQVLLFHAFRNSLIPVIALLSVQFGHMLSGSIITESVFAIQGIGLLAWESIKRNDTAVVQGIVVVVAGIYIALVTATDLLAAVIDPRVRTS
jgi:peptide/nickel transport system permease protein